jgi:BirA family biotin operon repressor/biotin-[acetyl-CoA-carboxylase] ligase
MNQVSLTAETSSHSFGCWTVHDWAEASSTNDLARAFPAWHIARCIKQHNGRGRFNRTWFGTQGGLWASFNVPLIDSQTVDSTAVHWGHLPLVAGLALLDYLKSLGVQKTRLRWPNDLLIDKSKLAGILVERPRAELAVIGIGINVFNDIESLRGRVKDSPIRLSDCVKDCPTIEEVTQGLASAIQQRWEQFSSAGLESLLPDINCSWGPSLPVRIETDEGSQEGLFLGITSEGAPILQQPDGSTFTIPGYLINRLVEI